MKLYIPAEFAMTKQATLVFSHAAMCFVKNAHKSTTAHGAGPKFRTKLNQRIIST